MENSKMMSERLNQLLKKNLDAEKEFREASDKVEDKRLKEFFHGKALQHYDFKQELESEIRNFGESPEEDSTVAGDARRTWMDLKRAFSSNKAKAILEETERGEKVAIEEYNHVINDTNFPPSTANLLLRQRNAIERTMLQMEGLEQLPLK